jgi:hypothetical protein
MCTTWLMVPQASIAGGQIGCSFAERVLHDNLVTVYKPIFHMYFVYVAKCVALMS